MVAEPRCHTCGATIPPSGLTPGVCPACLLADVLRETASVADLTPEAYLEAGSTLGPFRIGNPLGRGGMASVYEGYEPRLDRAVAIKVLAPQFLRESRFAQRFAQEARVAAALEHPHIVPIYASGIDDGLPWISMRLLRGGTLNDQLNGEPMPATDAIAILRGVASALDYAHARGVIHRDIKPSNILLDHGHGVFVADFGVARLVEQDPELTRSGVVVGTPQYMAPEQALGHVVDHRCDLYSLGVVAYEMLTGRPPFSGRSPLAVLMRHVKDPVPTPAPGLVTRPALDVLLRALSKEPKDRWPSAGTFVDALTHGVQEPHTKTAWRRVVTLATAAAALFGGIVMLAHLLAGPTPDPPVPDPPPSKLSVASGEPPLIDPPRNPPGRPETSHPPGGGRPDVRTGQREDPPPVSPPPPPRDASTDPPVFTPTTPVNASSFGSGVTLTPPPPPPTRTVDDIREAILEVERQPRIGYSPAVQQLPFSGTVEFAGTCLSTGRVLVTWLNSSRVDLNRIADEAKRWIESHWRCQPRRRNGIAEDAEVKPIHVVREPSGDQWRITAAACCATMPCTAAVGCMPSQNRYRSGS